jgi:hypothetical protein
MKSLMNRHGCWVILACCAFSSCSGKDAGTVMNVIQTILIRNAFNGGQKFRKKVNVYHEKTPSSPGNCYPAGRNYGGPVCQTLDGTWLFLALL